MDLKKFHAKNNRFDDTIDELTIKKMFSIRFKLMNFLNSAHDLICNQVSF